MTKHFLVLLLFFTMVPAHARTAASSAVVPEACDEGWVEREVRSPAPADADEATEDAVQVKISCHLTLRSSDTISKRLVFDGAAATGVSVDCNGASLDPTGTVNEREDRVMISIVAGYIGEWQWDTPENISITGCSIVGSIKIYAEGSRYTLSRYRDYPQRIRNGAPKHITLDGLNIIGTGQNDLVYLYSGVTHVTFTNSRLSGNIDGVPLYLDAESGYNTIRGNRIEVDTDRREQLAIDGSSHNLIVNNYFSGLDTGGIYLYRNCGEKGTIRHTTPSFNHIINNYFYYQRYTEENPAHWGDTLNPAVFVGSRHTDAVADHRHCDDDDGYPFGSSIDDRDLARNNVIAQNQIRKRDPKNAIRSKEWRLNRPYYRLFNERVEARINRKAGCFIVSDIKWEFFLHGENYRPDGRVFATYRCNDGNLVLEDLRADPNWNVQ